tara:strand:- start:2310 stop:2993 length:684 start_codon:yes stop_codon:yes gene_type:complete
MSYFAITSNHPRHVKFLESLYERVDLSLVIIVDKGPILHEEADYFQSDLSLLYKDNILRCDKEQLHSRFVLQTIEKLNPNVGFVFGAPLLKESLFGIPKFGCVNIHTGLVDHYRGVDSTYWAIKDARLDLIGSTLHYIDDSIDGGDVIGMRKVVPTHNDSPETLFYKSCEVGFDLLKSNMHSIINNKVVKFKLDKTGKLYQNKDMNDEVMSEINNKFPKLLGEYVWK